MDSLVKMAKELLIIYEDMLYRVKDREEIYNFELYDFDQTWSSTALGFGGMGGQMMTSARTYVIVTYAKKCYVYFGGRHAYIVPLNEKVMNDIKSQMMKPVSQRGYYLKEEK